MSWWKRKAPKCESEAAEGSPRSKSDKEVLALLEEEMNSSWQRPGLAHLHNEDQKKSATPQLLGLPDNVLNKILRMVVVESAPIPVAADHPEDCSDRFRGVLSVCRTIREKARPMYYQENLFEVQVFKFDIKAVLPWLKMAERFQKCTTSEGIEAAESHGRATSASTKSEGFDVKTEPRSVATTNFNGTQATMSLPRDHISTAMKPAVNVITVFSKSYDRFVKFGLTQKQTEMLDYFMCHIGRTLAEESSSATTGLYIVPKFEPHWYNLVEWLSLYHRGEVGRYAFEPSTLEFCPAVSSLFDLVEIEKEEKREWEVFERRLNGLRGIIGEVDAGWLLES